jgi:hypothetical protein
MKRGNHKKNIKGDAGNDAGKIKQSVNLKLYQSVVIGPARGTIGFKPTNDLVHFHTRDVSHVHSL